MAREQGHRVARQWEPAGLDRLHALTSSEGFLTVQLRPRPVARSVLKGEGRRWNCVGLAVEAIGTSSLSVCSATARLVHVANMDCAATKFPRVVIKAAKRCRLEPTHLFNTHRSASSIDVTLYP